MEHIGRVIEVQRKSFSVQLNDSTVVYATVRGQFHESGAYPKVGDQVAVVIVEESEEAQAVIERILPRTSVIERFDEVNNRPQVLVANVNLIFIVMGLDGDFSVARLERYLALAAQSNIEPVIILNKADLATAEVVHIQAVKAAAPGIPVHVVQADAGVGLEQLLQHITNDTLAVLLGSSGAGKSTITNWLLGEERQAVAGVRGDDSKGRHTTTTRQLFSLPNGGSLIDTPGMRELAIVADVTPHDSAFTQIETLAEECKFRNCDHIKSDGCAVLAAVESGELSQQSYENYQKLLREEAWQQDKDGKSRHADQTKKRSAQARVATERKRLSRR